jgi:hypothetical protein
MLSDINKYRYQFFMGHGYSVQKYFPCELTALPCYYKRISSLTSDHCNTIIDNLNEKHYRVMIIFCSIDLKIKNYDELSSRLAANNNNIVVVVDMNSRMNNKTMANFSDTYCTDMFAHNDHFNTFLFQLTKNLKNEFMIIYGIDPIIDKYIFIGHGTSCNDLIHLCFCDIIKEQQIILIDPMTNTETYQYIMHTVQLIEEEMNAPLTNLMPCITMILPENFSNNCSCSIQGMIGKLTTSIYEMPNIESIDMYNVSVSGFNEINTKSHKWDLVAMTINDISSIK